MRHDSRMKLISLSLALLLLALWCHALLCARAARGRWRLEGLSREELDAIEARDEPKNWPTRKEFCVIVNGVEETHSIMAYDPEPSRCVPVDPPTPFHFYRPSDAAARYIGTMHDSSDSANC